MTRRPCARHRTAGRSSPSSGTESNTATRSRLRSATVQRRCAAGWRPCAEGSSGPPASPASAGRRSSSAAARAARCSGARTLLAGSQRKKSPTIAAKRLCTKLPTVSGRICRSRFRVRRATSARLSSRRPRDRAATRRRSSPSDRGAGRRLRHPCEILDRVGQDRRRWTIEPMPVCTNPSTKLRSRRSSSSVRSIASAQIAHMLVERPGHVQQAAVLVEQVVEVQRAFLRAGVFGHSHREHRMADDARLDLRAGVDADRGGRVIHRVEVVVLRCLIDRVGAAARPQHDVPVRSETVESLPRLRVLGVRADQDAEPGARADPVRSERREPTSR